MTSEPSSDGLCGIAQGALARLVASHLVPRRPVVLERQGHRRWAPQTITAVLEALPFVDAALQLALEGVRRVGQAEDGERHLDTRRRAPGDLELVGEDRLVVRDDVTSTDAAGSGPGSVGVAPSDPATHGAAMAWVSRVAVGRAPGLRGCRCRSSGRRPVRGRPARNRSICDGALEQISPPEGVGRDRDPATRPRAEHDRSHDDAPPGQPARQGGNRRDADTVEDSGSPAPTKDGREPLGVTPRSRSARGTRFGGRTARHESI
jgi:hypothetical protein